MKLDAANISPMLDSKVGMLMRDSSIFSPVFVYDAQYGSLYEVKDYSRVYQHDRKYYEKVRPCGVVFKLVEIRVGQRYAEGVPKGLVVLYDVIVR